MAIRVDDIILTTTDVTLSAEIIALRAGQATGVLGYASKAILDADLAHADKTVAIVTNDPTPANNGTYRKSGASGAGSWVPSSYDRVALVETGVAAITGGSALSDAQLKEMALAEAFTITAVTARDADSGLLTTATITWRDGSAGTLAGAVNAAVGAYSTMVYTHTASGKTATLTIGREADGTVAWTSIVVTS